MYCQACGKQIPDDSKYCRFCGVEQKDLPLIVQPSTSPPKPAKPVKPADPVEIKIEVPEPRAPRRTEPAAPAQPVVPATPSQPAPVVTTSGEWDEAEFVVSFAGRNMPSLRVNGLGVGKSMDEGEARRLLWKTYQSEVDMKLAHWTRLGWQPVTPIAAEGLVLRRFSGYKDKSAVYWILMLLAAIPSIGISLIVALIPSTFVEPDRFTARLRARRGTARPA